MILTHIDFKYVSLIYRKIRQKVPNGKGLTLWVQGWEGFMGSYNRFNRTYHKTMINLEA